MGQHNINSIRKFFPLFFIIFIDTIGYFIVIPIMIRLFIHGDGNLLPAHTSMATRDLLYSVVMMLSPLAFIIFSPIIGHFSDRYGRKNALTYALIAACVGFLLPIIGILTRHISLIFIGRLIAGASSSSQPVAQAGVTDFTTGKIRALYLSFIGFAMTLGMVIGPLSGSYLSDSSLVSWFNVTTPYWFAFILSAINVILLITSYKDSTQVKIQDKPISATPRISFFKLIIHNQIGLLLLIFFCMEVAWSQYYQASFLTLSQHFHYSTNKISIFAAYVGLWMCLGMTVIYKFLIKHYEIKKIIKYSLCIGASSFVLCNIPNTTAQWILMIPVTIAIGLIYPSLLALMSHRTSAEHQGYVLGCASTVLGIAWMVTGLIAGPLAQNWFAWPNITASIAMVLGFILMFYIKSAGQKTHGLPS